MARKGYPAELPRRALDLVAAQKPVAKVRDADAGDQSICPWRRQERIEWPGYGMDPAGLEPAASSVPR